MADWATYIKTDSEYVARMDRIRRGARTHLYITEWMNHLDVNDEQVAGRMGVSRQTVWKWRKEQWRLRPDKIAHLAEALGLESATDLYRLPHAKPSRESIDAIVADAPEEIFEALLDHAKRLAGRHH